MSGALAFLALTAPPVARPPRLQLTMPVNRSGTVSGR